MSPAIAICIGCGCSDERACPGSCSWLRLDRRAREGVCSRCDAHVARWDGGDRSHWYGEPDEDVDELLDDESLLLAPGEDDYELMLDLLDQQPPTTGRLM